MTNETVGGRNGLRTPGLLTMGDTLDRDETASVRAEMLRFWREEAEPADEASKRWRALTSCGPITTRTFFPWWRPSVAVIALDWAEAGAHTVAIQANVRRI